MGNMKKREKKDILRGIIENLPKVPPKCSFAGSCGGCFMQHVAYEDQVQAKQKFLTSLFEKNNIPLEIGEVVHSPDTFYYRNRMDYPVGRNGEIGLKPAGMWKSVLNLTECFLLSEETPTILQTVRDWMSAHALTGWDAVKHTGYIRYVVIREGKRTNERMITMICNTHPENLDVQKVWDDLVARLQPFVTTLYRGMQTSITDISETNDLELLCGKEELHEIAGGITFAISPFSFFQTNTKAAEKLQAYVVDEVMQATSSDSYVLDMYCGTGFLTLPLAQKNVNVKGVELVDAAIIKAKENAIANNVHAEFIALKAEDHIKSMKKDEHDIIIIDPPRAGLHPKVIEKLCEVQPKTLVYVSCNPSKLVEELPKFLEVFAIKNVRAFDMFPHTPHVELVLTMQLK